MIGLDHDSKVLQGFKEKYFQKQYKSFAFSTNFKINQVQNFVFQIQKMKDWTFRQLLVESSVIVIFYVMFLMRYAVIIVYQLFWKKKIFNLEKTGGKKF